MSTMKHTPGPWLREGHTVYALMHFGFRKGVEQFKNRFWASVYKDNEVSEEEREANSCLIEAAPDLLDALQGAIALADKNKAESEEDGYTVVRLPEMQAMYDKCIAAIAKATGSTT